MKNFLFISLISCVMDTVSYLSGQTLIESQKHFDRNTQLPLYQYFFTNEFLRKSIIGISDFNPLGLNFFINSTGEQPLTEMVRQIFKITRETSKSVVVVDSDSFHYFILSLKLIITSLVLCNQHCLTTILSSLQIHVKNFLCKIYNFRNAI